MADNSDYDKEAAIEGLYMALGELKTAGETSLEGHKNSRIRVASKLVELVAFQLRDRTVQLALPPAPRSVDAVVLEADAIIVQAREHLDAGRTEVALAMLNEWSVDAEPEGGGTP